MNDLNIKDINKLNIELTSKCALSCSRCARVLDGDDFKQIDLPLELIKKRIPSSIYENNLVIDLSGNYGDPIYHNDFINVARYFKSMGANLYIETNGSSRSEEWWKEVCKLLTLDDVIAFSVDGLEDTNHLYRKKSNWDDILTAMKLCSRVCTTYWKYIVFKHNQHQIEAAKEMAIDIGISKFKLVYSSLFYYGFGEEEDELMPDDEFIEPGLIKSIRSRNSCNTDSKEREISPKCHGVQRHYISATGVYTPCCWLGVYSKDNNYDSRSINELSLYHQSLDKILESDSVKRLNKSFKKYDNAPRICQKKCSVKKTTNTSHAFNFFSLKKFKK